MRSLRLSWLLFRRSPLRNIVLLLLTTAAIVIFVLVAELSRVSQEGMDSAIMQETGLTGSYEVGFLSEQGVSVTDAKAEEIIGDLTRDLHLSIRARWTDLPNTWSECPPFDFLGEQSFRILRTPTGAPFALPYGSTAGVATRFCIDGQEIPTGAIYLPDGKDRAVYGERLYLHPDFENLALLATTAQARSGWVLVSGNLDAIESPLIAALNEGLAETVVGTDVVPDKLYTVRRLDQDNQAIREASIGVAVTYGVIGWGVLALGGAALIAVQTIVARQRAWFHGLTQSMGVGRSRLASMLATDTAFVILGALALSWLILWLGNGPIRDFAQDAFGVDANVLSPAAGLKVFLGMVAVLAVAVAAGAFSTARRDPLETLEAPRD